MQDYGIFDFEARLGKVSILIDNCTSCAEDGQDIEPLLECIQNEYKIITDDFQTFLKNIWPFLREINQ